MDELYLQINKSANALKNLLDKLEADGYLKSRTNLSVSEFIFNDIIAFLMLPAFCNLDVTGKDRAKNYLEGLTRSYGVAINDKAFNDFIYQYSSCIGNGKDIIPESFVIINNFDYQASGNNNRFYETIKVYPESPLSEYYINLIEAAVKVAEYNLKETDKVTVDFINSSVAVMRNEQV